MRRHVWPGGPSGVTVICLIVVGCTQQPGALRMEVVPERAVVGVGEPIYVTVRLITDKGKVCLARTRHFEIEITNPEAERESFEASTALRICGMGWVMTRDARVWHTLAGWMDVTDKQNRFELLAAGEKIEQEMTFSTWRHGFTRERLIAWARGGSEPYYEHAGWKPGRYTIRVRLVNEFHDWYPAPLFWSPYAPKIEASADIEVREEVDLRLPVPDGVRYTTESAPE